MVAGVQGIAAGRWHSVLVTQNGSVQTTGRNEEGQLGDGTTIWKSSFVEPGRFVPMLYTIGMHTVIGCGAHQRTHLLTHSLIHFADRSLMRALHSVFFDLGNSHTNALVAKRSKGLGGAGYR